MENPLLYSDLIKDDGSIDNLIAKLDEVISKYDSLVRRVQKQANDTVNSLNSVSGATENQRKQIEQSIQTQEELLASYKDWTSELRAAQRQEQNLKQAKKEATQVDKLMIQFTNSKIGSYNRLSAEYRILKMRLNEMTLAERNTAKGREMVNHARELYEQMSNLQKETGKYTLEVGHYQNAMLGLPGPLNQVTIAIGAFGNNLRQVFHSDMPAAEKIMAGFKVGVLGLITVFVALGKAVSGMIKTNAQFEQANANLATVLGKTRKDITALTDTALQLGRTTQWTSSQVTDLQTELAKLGFGEGSIIAMQKHILSFATAMGADLGEAATMAGAALRAFNLTSKDSERVMGTLAVGVNNSALTFDRIKYAMGTVFPIANAFGLEIEDVTALLGALANAGFSAESAATATRNMLLNLADANGKLAKRTGGAAKSFDDIIDKLVLLHNEGADLSEIFELTDKRSVAAFSALMAGSDVAKDLREKLSDVSGELKRIQDERLNTVQGQTLLLKSAWEGLTLAFRNSNGVIKRTLEGLTNLTQGIQRLFFSTQTNIQQAQDLFIEKFTSYYKDSNAELTKAYMEQYLTPYRKELDELEKDTSRKGKKRYEEALERYKGMYAGYKIMLTQIENDEAEAERQREMARQESSVKAQELTKQQKVQRIKDLQARIEQIKMEITYAEKGTQEMLKKRLELVEAERNLEIERNFQAEETAKKDIAVINAKYNKERLTTEENFWKEVSNLRIAALQADKKAIDDEISLTEDDTQRMIDLRVASMEKQRDIEIEQNKQKDEKIRQNEQAIIDYYDRKILMMRADFNTKMAKQDLERIQTLQEAEFELLDRNERQKTIFRLKQERQRLNALLEIMLQSNKEIADEEIDAIGAQMEAIDKELSRLPYNNIYEVLGLNLDENQQSSLNAAWSSTKSLLGDIIDSYEKMAEASVKAADKQVESAQKVLDAEIEAQKNGYANRVETAQKELELAQKNREKALRQQERAKRAQIALDSMEQASSLITASANIWKAFGGIPVVGPALAIAGIATMWGSFTLSKIRALQATKQEYGEGTVELLEGGSHASGKDIDLGYDRKKHRHRRAEGGEYFAVINRRNSRKYRNVIPDVIKSFNDGTFADKYQRASQSMGGMAVNIGSGTDVSVLEKNVKAIKEQGERQIITSNDRVIVKYKNLTQTLKK